MTSKTTSKEVEITEAGNAALSQLNACEDIAAMYTLAGSDDFKALIAGLSEGEADGVREHFAALLDERRNKVRLDDIAEEIVNVTGVRSGYSEKTGKDFVVITGNRPEAGDKPFEVITSAVQVVRYFNNMLARGREVDRVRFVKRDWKEGKTMWTLTHIPDSIDSSRIPF